MLQPTVVTPPAIYTVYKSKKNLTQLVIYVLDISKVISNNNICWLRDDEPFVSTDAMGTEKREKKNEYVISLLLKITKD